MSEPTYYGRPVSLMSRDELIAAVVKLGSLVKQMDAPGMLPIVGESAPATAPTTSKRSREELISSLWFLADDAMPAWIGPESLFPFPLSTEQESQVKELFSAGDMRGAQQLILSALQEHWKEKD